MIKEPLRTRQDYTRMAASYFDVPEDRVTPAQREAIKARGYSGTRMHRVLTSPPFIAGALCVLVIMIGVCSGAA